MDGKEKCEYLKKLRKEIADRNGIDYNPTSCTNEGPCVGTCPVCDKEAAELMAELRKKEASGNLIGADVENNSLIKKPSLTDTDEADVVLLDLSSVDMSSEYVDMTPGIIDLMGDIQVPDCDIIDGESDSMTDYMPDIADYIPDYMSDCMEDPEFPDHIDNEKSDEKP
jgi:hypothetical protein